MKKRKILYLIPFAALVLSGCTFQEGWEKTTGWLGDNIWTPVKEFFEGLFGGGGNKKQDQDEEGEDDPTPTPTPTPTPATPKHAGTLADPYDAADAKLMGSTVESGQYTPNAYYIKGEVQEITEEFDASYGSYTFMIEDGFKGYRMKNGESKAKFSEGDIEVGDEVLMYGPIQRFKDTYELSGTQAGQAYVVSVTKPAPTDADLVGVYIDGEPQTLYAPGAAYNHKGLSAWAYYEDGTEQDVTSAATWEISKQTAAASDESITITARYKDVYDSIEVSVTVSSDPIHAGTLEDPLDGADACLIASQLQESDKNNKYPSAKKYYIKGEVQELLEEFNSEYGNFTFTIENGFEGYRLKNGSEKAKFTSADDLVVGDTVTIYSDVLNFHGTYETNDGYVYSIEKEPVVVEDVVLSESSLALEVGDHASLSASVLPAEASQNVEWSVAQDGEIISFENGVVTGLSVGSATITATSVADPSKSDSCVVTVNEATKVLSSIAISGTASKTSYVAGENYSAAGLVVTASYENAADEDVTAFVEWTFSPEVASLGDDQVSITASYNNKEDSLVVPVTVAEQKGTADNPYTVAEARAAIDAGKGVTGVYAKGIVTSIPYPYSSTNKNISFFFSDDGTTTSEVEAFKLTADADPNVEVGDEVVVYGNLKKFNSTYEFDQGCTLAEHVKPTVESVSVSGTAAKTEYGVGQSYSHNGLVATALLSNGQSKDVSAEAEWSIEPATASLSDTEISITATYNNVTSDPVVVQVTVTDTPTPQTETTVTKTMQEIATANSWADATKYTSFALDGNISVSASGGSNTGKYYNNGTNWRIYQGENGTVTISAASGYEIKTAKITYTVSNTGIMVVGGNQVQSGTVNTVNASQFVFTVGNTGTATNGQVRVTAIEIVYTTI